VAVNEIFSLRRAQLADATAMAEVHVASWHAAYRGIISDANLARFNVASRAASWRRALGSNDNASVWLALEDDLVVGFSEVRGGEVTVLYLHPGWWRLGLGRALLKRAFADIAATGWPEVFLWVLAANEAARAFYGAEGGVAGDSRPVKVGDSRLVEVRYAWKLPVVAR
jgi:ribosomal protein S18 acetylase RimI-like enzyme